MFAVSPFALAPLALATDLDAPADPGPSTVLQAVDRLLRDDPIVAAMVGGRIRYARSGQTDRDPRITFLDASRTLGRDLDGPDDEGGSRIRISAWASDSVRAQALADAVRFAIDGFSGRVGSVEIRSIDHQVSVDLPEWAGAGGDDSYYQIAMDFFVDFVAPFPARG